MSTIEEGAISGAGAGRPATTPTAAEGAAPTPRPVRVAGGLLKGRRGKIEISPHAVATVAGRAVASSYGVVGIAARHPRLATVELLSPEHYSRGIVVRLGRDRVTVDLYVVLEHGLRITTVAHNIMQNVQFAVARTLGIQDVCVNVNVQALRVSRPKA
jgi:uncharacterized alkaline shock family protein YloU